MVFCWMSLTPWTYGGRGRFGDSAGYGFVLGDHRTESFDSRNMGVIAEKDLKRQSAVSALSFLWIMEEAAVLEKQPSGCRKVDILSSKPISFKPLTSRQKYKSPVPSTKSLENFGFSSLSEFRLRIEFGKLFVSQALPRS